MTFESQHACLKQIRSQLNDTNWYIICHLSFSMTTLSTNSLCSAMAHTIRSDPLCSAMARTILSTSTKKSLSQNLNQTIGLPSSTKPFCPIDSTINEILQEIDCQYLRYKHALLLAFCNKTPKNQKRSKVLQPGTTRHNALPNLLQNFNLTNIIEIRNTLKETLEILLKIPVERIEIFEAKPNKKIPFLGYFICHTSKKNSKSKTSIKLNMFQTIELQIDDQIVVKSLADMGFCDKSGKPKPNFNYYQKSQYDAIACASSILRGLACYYDLAKSKRTCLSRYSFIVTNSLALTFAAKYKLKSRSKVFSLAGQNLERELLSTTRRKTGNSKILL